MSYSLPGQAVQHRSDIGKFMQLFRRAALDRENRMEVSPDIQSLKSYNHFSRR